MRKLLLPTIDFPPARGGVARYIKALQKSFPDQVEVLPLRNKRIQLDRLVWKLLCRQQKYDAIWVQHILPVGTAAMVVKRMTGKPYVVFLHGLDFDLAKRNAWKRWLAKNVLQSADQIVTNSQALATEIRDFAQLSNAPLVVYPTVDDELVAAAKLTTLQKVNLHKLGELAVGVAKSQTPMFVQSKSKQAAGLKLLTVARLVDRKGHLKVLEAIKHMPDVTYHIVGDGPMRAEIESKIIEYGLNDRVQLSVGVEDEQLPDVYRAADVFVMPTMKSETDREGFGIVYLEAQLFGLPVIASKQPGVDEAVRDGEGGILIDESVNELVAAINRLKDPAARGALGSRGRVRVQREFVREQQMYKLRSLL